MGKDMDRRLCKLMEFGLRGVEVMYSGFTDKMRTQMLRFAKQYDLYVTAGSDYHGSNKLVPLGDTGLRMDMPWPEGLLRFLNDARIIRP